jgi:hypothetical protein
MLHFWTEQNPTASFFRTPRHLCCLTHGLRNPAFFSCKTFGIGSERAMNFTKNIGMLLLAIYLILAGIGLLLHTVFIPAAIMGILALAAGIFILIGK